MQISIVKSLDVQFLSHTSTRLHSWGAVLKKSETVPFSPQAGNETKIEIMKHVTKISRVYTFEFKSPKSKIVQRKIKKVGLC